MIAYKLEDFYDIIEEFTQHIERHYEEAAWYQERFRFNPDLDQYGKLQNEDMLYMYTMRDEGELLGYNVFYVHTHQHAMDSTWAINDCVYIAPRHRRTPETVGFFKFCEDHLKEQGVDVMSYHMLRGRYTGLMETLEMEHAEDVYLKYIG